MDIQIPELDEIYGTSIVNTWSEEEEEILHKYYNHVPFDVLMKYFQDRTPNSVRCKAKAMNLTKKRRR